MGSKQSSVWLHTLRLAFAVALCGPALSAAALGLGEIELDSALNERFDGEIEVLDSAALDTSEILVSLGSAEDFRRVGVERFFYLTDLRFEVERRGGKAVIRVTSGQPITEPYLNFLVEVLWPSGRMLKEYTVLLDPPTFVAAAPTTVTAPTRQRAESAPVGRTASAPTSSPRRGTSVAVPAAPSSAARVGSVSGDQYGPTDRDDTLWKIAERTRPSGELSVAQYMLALQRANPGAFINDNINYLKAGYTLDLPSESAARTLTNAQALAEVRAQTDEWRALREGRNVPSRERSAGAPNAVADGGDLRSPVDARPEQDTPVSDERADGVQLRVIAGNGEGGASQPADAPEGDVSIAGIDAIKEQKDELSREVEALAYQIDQQRAEYEKAIEQQERQLSVRDDKIAELERQLAERNDTAAQQAENPSASDDSTSTPWYLSTPTLIGAGGIVVLGLVGLMVARRRSAANDDAYDFDEDDSAVAFDDRPDPAVSDSLDSDAAAAPLIDADDDLEDDFSNLGGELNAIDDGDVLELDDEVEEAGADTSTPTSQTSDVLGEAEIYIAYGRYPQAVGLLLGVLEDDPERHDVRAKLLELYVETNDVEGFEEHRDALVERCDDSDLLDHVRSLENRLTGADADDTAFDTDVSEDDNNAGLGAPAGLAAAGAGLASVSDADADGSDDAAGTLDDFDLDIDLNIEPSLDGGDDTELDLDAAVDTTALSALDAEAGTASDDGFDLEFDDEPVDESLGGLSEADADERHDDLGGDLGIDFDPDSASTTTEADLDALLDDSDSSDDGDESALDDLAEAAQADLDGSDASSIDDAVADVDDDLDLAFAEAEGDGSDDGDGDFDFADGSDGADTKLDLARAYIDMADEDGARDILSEVLDEGNDEQRKTAQDLLDKL